MAIKAANLQELAQDLFASLGSARTQDGDLLSRDFTLAEDAESGTEIRVSLQDERAGLPRDRWGYILRIDGCPASGTYRDNGGQGTPEELVLDLLESTLAAVTRPVRLPTGKEWKALLAAVGVLDVLVHWQRMYFWCLNDDPNFNQQYMTLGYYSPYLRLTLFDGCEAEYVGFRPAFPAMDAAIPDGAIVTAGTLYMDGQPVKVPEHPTQNGDVADYIPGAKLEFRPALDDPAYQVRAIKIGKALISDRVLLRKISWLSLQAQGFC